VALIANGKDFAAIVASTPISSLCDQPRCASMFQSAQFAAFGAAATPGASGSAAGFEQWATNCSDTNTWLATEVTDEVRDALSKMEKSARTRVATTVRMKATQGIIARPCPYLLSTIRSEMSKSPYSGHRADGPSCAGGVGPPAAEGFRNFVPGPSPQQAPPPTPEWVLTSWQVHNKQAALFRALRSKIPASAMTKLAALPGQIQYVCAVSLLLTKEAHRNPEGFVDMFVHAYNTLPAVPSSFSGSSGSSCASEPGVKRLVVLSFGLSSGSEWLGLVLARSGFDDTALELVECISFASPCPWEPVMDEFLTGMAGPASVTNVKGTGDGLALLGAKAPGWRQRNATVLVIVHIPAPVDNIWSSSSSAPGYHAAGAGDIWSIFNTIRALGNHIPKIQVVTYQAVPRNPADAFYWDGLFGEATKVDVSSIRVPQVPWLVRGSFLPSELSASRPRATDTGGRVQELHVRLRAIFEPQKQCTEVLPSLSQLEDILDKESPSSETALSDERLQIMLRATAAGDPENPRRLLGRDHLAVLFGADGWNWMNYWSKHLPCAEHINAFTGQPSLAGYSESVACGTTRWCPACCHFYEALATTISPYAVQSALTACIKSLMQPETVSQESRNLFSISDLPQHVCSHPCGGL
jgi:hypothetical protein